MATHLRDLLAVVVSELAVSGTECIYGHSCTLAESNTVGSVSGDLCGVVLPEFHSVESVLGDLCGGILPGLQGVGSVPRDPRLLRSRQGGGGLEENRPHLPGHRRRIPRPRRHQAVILTLSFSVVTSPSGHRDVMLIYCSSPVQ